MYTAKFPIENNARVSEDGGREGEKGESERDRQTKEVGETEKKKQKQRQAESERNTRCTQTVASIFARVMSRSNDPRVLPLTFPPLWLRCFHFFACILLRKIYTELS